LLPCQVLRYLVWRQPAGVLAAPTGGSWWAARHALSRSSPVGDEARLWRPKPARAEGHHRPVNQVGLRLQDSGFPSPPLALTCAVPPAWPHSPPAPGTAAVCLRPPWTQQDSGRSSAAQHLHVSSQPCSPRACCTRCLPLQPLPLRAAPCPHPSLPMPSALLSHPTRKLHPRPLPPDAHLALCSLPCPSSSSDSPKHSLAPSRRISISAASCKPRQVGIACSRLATCRSLPAWPGRRRGATPGCWVLLGAAGCCWELLGAAGCCWVLLGAAGCCWVLLGAAECCCMIVGQACPLSMHAPGRSATSGRMMLPLGLPTASSTSWKTMLPLTMT